MPGCVDNSIRAPNFQWFWPWVFVVDEALNRILVIEKLFLVLQSW